MKRARHGMIWSSEENATLQARYAKEPVADLASDLGRSVGAVLAHAIRLDCVQPVRKRPSRTRYHALLRLYCEASGVAFEEAISRGRSLRVARVRWAAWRDLHRHCRASFSGIGSIAGYDHTSVSHGIRRITEEEVAAAQRERVNAPSPMTGEVAA